jgi:hypothetical protein
MKTLFAVLALSFISSYAQQTPRETTDEVLLKGEIVAKNIQTAIRYI